MASATNAVKSTVTRVTDAGQSLANSATSAILYKNGPLDEIERRWAALVQCRDAIVNASGLTPAQEHEKLNSSPIKAHLKRIVELLEGEDLAASRRQARRELHPEDPLGTVHGGAAGQTGPCLEFVLEQELVRQLCEFAESDRPLGFMTLVLRVLRRLMERIHHTPLFLSARCVHHPIYKLLHKVVIVDSADGRVALAPAHAASSAAPDLAMLVCAIWPRIREDPAQINFFFKERAFASKPLLDTPAQEGGGAAEVTGAAVGATSSRTSARPQLLLFSALLPFMHSIEAAVGPTVRETIVLALGLQDARLNSFVSLHSGFADTLAVALGAS